MSYARADADVCKALVEQLRLVIGLQPGLELFVDRGIRTGKEWRKEIDAALDRTVVGVFLISASLLNSDFVRSVEIPSIEAARRAGLASVACLYVRPAAAVRSAAIQVKLPDGTQTTVRLADFQGINDPGQALSGLDPHGREALLASAAERIAEMAVEVREPAVAAPFVGPADPPPILLQPKSTSVAPRTVRVEPAGLDLVRISGGTFWMGSADDDKSSYPDERPRHRVQVEPFLLAATPVTNAQYRWFLAATARREPEHWSDPSKSGPAQPVVGVSWEDATAFCEWAGLRLPSEAEWEYACRAGTTTRYWSGDDESDLARVGWYSANSGGLTKPVAQMPANPWGLFDMHGNVWEWCQDEWHNDYTDAPTDGSAGPHGGGSRVVRGGSWYYTARNCRSASRLRWHPGNRYDYLGFRPARFVTD